MDSVDPESFLLDGRMGEVIKALSPVIDEELDRYLKTEPLYDLMKHELPADCSPGNSFDFENMAMNDPSRQNTAAADSSEHLAYGDGAPSPSCIMPSIEDYPGPFEFKAELTSIGSHQTNGEYSSILNKAFILMGAKIPFSFERNSNNVKLYVRALLIFLNDDSRTEPVARCPSHTSRQEKSNDGFEYVRHVIRCEDRRTIYDENFTSGRLSTLVPLDPLQPGTKGTTVMFSFMCKNSCILGMDRRDTAIIFTLETEAGEVVGRRTMELRICSCPKRDRRNQEKKKNEKIEPSSITCPKGKKVVKKKPVKRPATDDNCDMTILQFPVAKIYKKPLLRVIREFISMPQAFRDLNQSEKATIDACNMLELE